MKFNIKEKIYLRAKNVSEQEYEAVMDLFRAAMLAFEKELRKLHDRRIINDKTLKDITKKLDLSEIARLSFSTLEPTKFVKMTDVQRVVKEFSDQTTLPSPESFPHPPDPKKLSNDSQMNNSQIKQTIEQLPSHHEPIIGQDSPSTTSSESIFPSKPISPKETATAVMELRKLMIENLKKFRKQYSE